MVGMTKRKMEVGTINNTWGTTVVTANIMCKLCDKRFERLEWMKNKDCDNPNCRCPEIQKLKQITNQVIDKASRSSSAANIQSIKRNTLPTGYEEKVNQYMVDVPDVMVVDIIVPKTNGKKRK